MGWFKKEIGTFMVVKIVCCNAQYIVDVCIYFLRSIWGSDVSLKIRSHIKIINEYYRHIIYTNIVKVIHEFVQEEGLSQKTRANINYKEILDAILL